jgi:hypothetical protein
VKKLVIILIAQLIILPAYGQKEDIKFTLLKYTASQSIILDTALTYDAIWNHGKKEGNPLIAWYIDKPVLTITFDMAFILAMNIGTDWLYRKGTWGKVLSYAIVIGINLIQAHTLYAHWEVRKE